MIGFANFTNSLQQPVLLAGFLILEHHTEMEILMNTKSVPIKQILNQIINPNNELFLSQTYKGFLFTEPVKYKSSESDHIRLMVNHKVFCFCHTKDAILHDQMLKSKITGEVTSFDLQSGRLLLQNVQHRKDPVGKSPRNKNSTAANTGGYLKNTRRKFSRLY